VGYFNDPVIAANTIQHSDHEGIAGTYVTLNPVVPDAFARISNRMVAAKAGMFTNDKEILERRGLLLDFDPKRISGISSTDNEHEIALAHMMNVAEDLTLFHGFPVPCLVDSGNGGHSRYMIERLPNDQDSTNLIKAFLYAAHERYKSDKVDIDKTVFNASRIVRIPGTPARKGESTLDRPHRVSRVLRDFDPFDILTRSAMERFLSLYGHLAPQKPRTVLEAHREYPEDEQLYRSLNKIAKERYHDWVPDILGSLARPSGEGYRIDSDALGRDLQESIAIDPMGIKDFGVADMGDATEGRRTAVSLISELITGNKRQAAEILSKVLDVPVTPFEGKLILPPPKPILTADGEPVIMPEALMGSHQFAMPKNGYYDVDILSMERTKWLIDDFVIENGYTVVSAPTKMGKSTLTKQIIAACLTGTSILGSSVEKCEVLYVNYEDMQNDIIPDLRNIIESVLIENGVSEENLLYETGNALKGLHFYARELNDAGEYFHRVPTGSAGQDFIVDLATNVFPNVKLICVDPIRLLRNETRRSNDVVTQQYHEGLDFVSLCVKANAAVWGLHHNNKESGKKTSEGNDPLISAGGTAAILGAAQNCIVFEGDRVPKGIDGAIGLYIAPRISQTRRKIVKFYNGQFYEAPPDTEIYYHRNQPKTADPQADLKILAFLDQNTVGTAIQIAEALNMQKYTVDRRLDTLKMKGMVDVSKDETGIHRRGRGAPARVWFLIGQATLPKRLPDLL
jgi:DNA-binding transcriptional ArsR family regulator